MLTYLFALFISYLLDLSHVLSAPLSQIHTELWRALLAGYALVLHAVTA